DLCTTSSGANFFMCMASPPRSLPRMREQPVRTTRRLMSDSQLILARGNVSQRRMATTRIVPALQPSEDLAARFLARSKVIPIQHLGLQAGKEGFHHCVVETVADTAHRTGDPELETAVREGDRRIFGTVVRMVDHPLGVTLLESHLQRLEYECAGQTLRHRPSDHVPGEHIQYRRQIQPSLIGGDVGHVGQPQSVRAACHEMSLDQVRSILLGLSWARSAAEATLLHSLQARAPHQPSHPFAPHTHPVLQAQLHVDPRRSVGAIERTLVDLVDQGGQLHISAVTLRHRSITPVVEPRRGDLQQPAHHAHRVNGLVLLHEFEERFEFGAVSCANQAAAFDRISRSICSCLFSRRSRASSSRSAVVSPPSPRPSSRSACLIHRLIAQFVGPNRFDSSATELPARCSSTIWRWNSFGYRFAYFDFGTFDVTMANTSNTHSRACTKAGQVQSSGVT